MCVKIVELELDNKSTKLSNGCIPYPCIVSSLRERLSKKKYNAEKSPGDTDDFDLCKSVN